jgi:hypothetical protein
MNYERREEEMERSCSAYDRMLFGIEDLTVTCLWEKNLSLTAHQFTSGHTFPFLL